MIMAMLVMMMMMMLLMMMFIMINITMTRVLMMIPLFYIGFDDFEYWIDQIFDILTRWPLSYVVINGHLFGLFCIMTSRAKINCSGLEW